MSEYGNEEYEPKGEEAKEEQEVDKDVNENKEINMEDFHPGDEDDLNIEGQSFEPLDNIENLIHEMNFEPHYTTFENTDKNFEPTYSETDKNACRVILNPKELSFIDSILNDPTLSTAEKMEALQEKLDKLWKNPDISFEKKEKIASAIDDALTDLKIQDGWGILTSNPLKDNTSEPKDNQNLNETKINNQEDIKTEQSEKIESQHSYELSKGFKEENNNIRENLIEDQTSEIKNGQFNNKEILNKSYDHITELTPKFLNYIKKAKRIGKEKIPNFYPNRGLRITDKFKEWIKNNEIDPFKINSYLVLIEQINKNKDIQEIIKHNVITTNQSLKGISRNLKVYGLNISPQTIKNVAVKHVYNDDLKLLQKRFPTGTGGFLQETYLLDKNGISYENLDFLQEKFKQYHEFAKKDHLKNKYANRGAKITTIFIKWIRENEKNLDLRNKYINAAKKVTKEGEIPQYVMEKTINSNLSMRAISDVLKQKGIYLSHHAIGDYARDHVLENENAKIERFPSTTEIIPEELYEKIREEVKKFYPIPQRWISKKLGVSRNTIERIAKNENTKEEYERKWPARDKISDETRDSVINDIKNTNLNMIQIANKHNISPNTVKIYAKEDVFKDDDKSYENRFPIDVSRLLGTQTHFCILDELTTFFQKYHKETFFAEPKIYRNTTKGTDGLILNDQKFLQRRLIDPNNKNDLSLLIHNIPAKPLSTQLDHIKAIQFDLTNDITDKNLIKKGIKYQRPDLMLYIIGTQWYLYDPVKPLPNDENILYPENIKVISHELFADLIGFHGKAKEHFNRIIDLNYDIDLDSLRKIHELNKIKWNDIAQLRNELKQKGLIKRSINEYFKIPPKYNQKKLM